MRIVFIGPPGAGKGTQSARLLSYLGIPHLSTGDMLRAAIESGSSIGKEAASYMNHGELVPDALIVDLLGERLEAGDCQKGCLLDGFPRTLGQAESLDDYLRQNGSALDVVLAIQVEEDELVGRLSQRGRSDDRPDAIRQRLRDFNAITRPVLDYYKERGLLHNVPGQGSPDDVFERIRNVVDGVAARRT